MPVGHVEQLDRHRLGRRASPPGTPAGIATATKREEREQQRCRGGAWSRSGTHPRDRLSSTAGGRRRQGGHPSPVRWRAVRPESRRATVNRADKSHASWCAGAPVGRRAARRLAPDQRGAATAPPGPVLCVAPAGSRQDDDARRAGRLARRRRARPGAITVVTFNKRAAEELDGAARRGARAARRRVGRRPRPDVPRARARDPRGGRRLGRAAHRPRRAAARAVPGRDRGRPRPARPRVLAAEARPRRHARTRSPRIPAPGPGRARVRRVRARDRGVGRRSTSTTSSSARSRLLEDDDAVLAPLARRGARTCSSTRRRTSTGPSWSWRCSSPRPANRIFLVGDDDQSIYGWRLADVRRVLGLAGALPGLRRVDLEHELPLPAAGRRAGRPARRAQPRAVRQAHRRRADAPPGRLVLAPDAADDVVRIGAGDGARWPDDDATRAVLARTNRELLVGGRRRARARPAVPGAGPRRCRSRTRGSMRCSTGCGRGAGRRSPLLVALGALRRSVAEPRLPPRATTPADDRRARRPPSSRPRSSAGRPRFPTLAALREAIDARRAAARGPPPRRRAAHPRDRPRDEGPRVGPRRGARPDGVPERRSVADATEPERALEEERRLAYVAWTRARRSLTLLLRPRRAVAVPARGVHPDELGLEAAAA